MYFGNTIHTLIIRMPIAWLPGSVFHRRPVTFSMKYISEVSWPVVLICIVSSGRWKDVLSTQSLPYTTHQVGCCTCIKTIIFVLKMSSAVYVCCI